MTKITARAFTFDTCSGKYVCRDSYMHKSTCTILSQNRNAISFYAQFNKLCRLKNDNNIEKAEKEPLLILQIFSKSMLSKIEENLAGKILFDILDILFFLCGVIAHPTSYGTSCRSNLKYPECLNLLCAPYFFP